MAGFRQLWFSPCWRCLFFIQPCGYVKPRGGLLHAFAAYVWPDFVDVEEGVWWELDSGLSACEFGIHQYSVLYLIWVAASEKGSARTVLEAALNRLAKLIGDTNEQL